MKEEATVLCSMKDFSKVREDFPILKRRIGEYPLAYLDTANSAQKPQQVIDKITEQYAHSYANVSRGVHTLGTEVTEAYEGARKKIRAFINAADEKSIIFTKGATEGLNLVASSFGEGMLSAGEVVVLSEMEHHSNIVPWQLLRDRKGIEIRVVPVSDDGALDMGAYAGMLDEKVKLVGVTHMSNVMGTVNPIKEMVEMAHGCGAKVLVDGCQAVAHMPVDVRDLDCDFYAFSSHKIYGPSGTGVLYGKYDLLDAMPPYHGGGSMIGQVTFEKTTYKKPPHRYEAGTPPIVQAIGMGAAVDYLSGIGMQNIVTHEQELLEYAQGRLMEEVPGLRMIGTAEGKKGVMSFVLEGVHAHDVATFVDQCGVAVRAGHHCAQPLMARYGVVSTARASVGVYSNKEDVDQLIDALQETRKFFKL